MSVAVIAFSIIGMVAWRVRGGGARTASFRVTLGGAGRRGRGWIANKRRGGLGRGTGWERGASVALTCSLPGRNHTKYQAQPRQRQGQFTHAHAHAHVRLQAQGGSAPREILLASRPLASRGRGARSQHSSFWRRSSARGSISWSAQWIMNPLLSARRAGFKG